jgi:FixJ family two-component response regulator
MARSATSESNSTICVVESDGGESAALNQVLSHLHVPVRCFPSAEALLEALEGLTPSVLISRLELPGMTGVELIRELAGRGHAPPTILLSSAADVATAVNAMRAGAVDFIQRPVVDRILLRRVRDALEHQA